MLEESRVAALDIWKLGFQIKDDETRGFILKKPAGADECTLAAVGQLRLSEEIFQPSVAIDQAVTQY